MRSSRKFAAGVLAIIVICGFSVVSEAEQIRLKVSGAKVDCVDVPVHTVIDLPESFANVPVEQIAVGLRQTSRGGGGIYGKLIPGQIVKSSDKKAELWWVVPRVEVGKTTRWTAALNRREKADKDEFSWRDKEGDYLDLLFGGRKVTRYMYAYDTSSPQRTFETYKPLHHVFDAQGKNLLTNGPDGEHPYTKGIKYPHHRGIFIGWNRLEFGGQQYDLWHMKEAHQVHQEFLELSAGPVLAKAKALIHWNDKNGEPIIAEQRETTVFRQSEPTILLLEFHTKLKAVRGDVFLNGDPEHAGFQYRAHDDVAKGGKEVKATYLFHKDGIDPKKDYNLPWAAMSYGLNGRRYSVQHMNHPDNPAQQRWVPIKTRRWQATIYSAYRDYGRFGAFFKEEIRAGKTLTLRYRIWVGLRKAMPKRQAQQRWVPKDPPLAGADRYSAFVNGPKVEVLSARTP
ncbi:MAG: PmoA family protein [Planctomycetes bacterium]|nr:PmoA family protein [Planctomycetota bacterium]